MESINQKNIFGPNIITITYPEDRNLTEYIKKEIIQNLKKLSVNAVAIQFDHSGETEEFVGKISSFLRNNKYIVTGDKDFRMGGGIKRKEFTIVRHPSVKDWAIMSVGTL